MAFFATDYIRKISKWTDDIARDMRYFGVGSVSKQIQYPNGTRVDMPSEDRSFSYELKENEIYAYGILDGFNGSWTVDFIEQCLLSNIYFDHLFSLQKKTDEEIYALLKEEFIKTEQALRDHLEELLVTRSSITFIMSDLRKGTMEFLEKKREINEIDKKIESGAFATISLIINDRMFVANIGNVHCFVCTYDKKTLEKRVITLETVHTLDNIQEMLRLADLRANVQEAILNASPNLAIPYTRCLGNFKHKFYYHEQQQFKDCERPPILSEPDHPKSSLKINDSFLFMAMYSDGLANAIKHTDMGNEDVNAVIAKMLLRKIVSEQTLNSAAQSVLDEIKRAYDDKTMSVYHERDDFTLIVRAFDLDIKDKLADIEQRLNPTATTPTSASHTPTMNRRVTFIEAEHHNSDNDDYDDDDDEDYDDDGYGSNQASRQQRRQRRRRNSSDQSLDSSLVLKSLNGTKSETARSAEKTKREDLPAESLLDPNGNVLPYLDLERLDRMLNTDENRDHFDDFYEKLASLKTDRI